MSDAGRVIGVMLSHDEWPLLALSASHALVHNVDELWVVDHFSADRTLEGLRILQEIFGERLHVLHTGDVAYRQEAITAWAMDQVRPSAQDWIYVVDADEFLLVGEGRALRDLLSDVPEGIDDVRYSLDNFVAPRDFAFTSLDAITRVTACAPTARFIEASGPQLTHMVESGETTFFDHAFHTKVIVRNVPTWITAGAHDVGGMQRRREIAFSRDVIRCAHVPLIVRSRLDQRAEAGRRLIAAGYGPDHGWQSQLLWRLSQAGRLDEFWRHHSVGEGGHVSYADEELALSFSAVLERLRPLQERLLNPSPTTLVVPAPTVDDVFGTLAALQRRITGIMNQRAERAHEINDQLRQALGERDELARERHELLVERDAMRASTSWRIGNAITRFVARLTRRTRR